MEKEKFILVSTSDESMSIDNEEFNTLIDAQARMREEWESNDPDTNYDDYIRDTEALIVGAYVRIWKIIKVSF